jgi:hypothetical protein
MDGLVGSSGLEIPPFAKIKIEDRSSDANMTIDD